MNPQVGFLLNQSLGSLRNSNLDSAELYLKQALRIQSNNPHVLRLLGVVYAQRKKYSEALNYLNKALKHLPRDSLILSNLGNVFLELKKYNDALDAYDKSIKIDPMYAEAWSNKGNALHELKRYDEAIAHHDRALSLDPSYAEAWSNKGNVLHELKRYDEAIAHHDRALSLNPDYSKGWSNKGNALNQLKHYGGVILHLDKALSLDPDMDWVPGNLLHAKMRMGNWVNLNDSINKVIAKIAENKKVASPFELLSVTEDALLLRKYSEVYAQEKYPENLSLGLISKLAKKDKIRIAYVSPDFGSHPVSFLTSELFELHDRNKFEIFAISLKKSSIGDEMNLRLRESFDRFIDVDSMSDQEIAQLVRELEVDIAVDLAGITQDSRTGIFSYRAAPIQVNWLGYPGTIGAKFIDYIVADKVIIPDEHRQFYVEKVAYLPDTYMVDDSKRVASSRVFTREECGLPQNAFVFCCFNNDYKFNPQVIDSWSNILLSAKNSVLWISENNEYFKNNIRSEFEGRGIESSRIIFAQRVDSMADHLARYSLADLFLDTFPYNAHTTAMDSLKAGIPVLTLRGQSFPGRVAASLLSAMGLAELIANNQEEYEALAIELALDVNKLALIKQKLSSNRLSAPLFDTQLFTKNLETVYMKMMERCRADLPPEHIYIA